jgi:FAD/FMN-containing dehydrogenase
MNSSVDAFDPAALSIPSMPEHVSGVQLWHSWPTDSRDSGRAMKRRDLLRAAAALPLLSGASAASIDRTKSGIRRTQRRVRPSDAAWPSQSQWEQLKRDVGGNLIPVRPLFAACAAEPQGSACLDVLKNARNPFYLGDQPAGTQVSGWLDAWTPAASAYAVAARGAADVAAAVNFARVNNVRLVVKGGGHSYQGTSNAPDSLLVWTRAMNAVSLHDAFVGKGCEGQQAPTPAVTVDAGALWIDAYEAVTTRAGRYVQGGGCTTVGVAGLVQSGGFGSLSKGFGTAAGGLLEAEIVTADGIVRTVNACLDADLFWALKGGGGGSWGVITKLTLRTHELPEFFGFAAGTIKANSDAAFARLIARFLGFYGEALFNPHWGESVKIKPDNTLELSMVCQGLDTQQSAAVWQPFFDWAKSSSDLSAADLQAGSGPARAWWDAVARKKRGSDAMLSDERPGAPAFHAWWSGDKDQVSAYLHGYESLWLPAALLHKAHEANLAGALMAASRRWEVELHFNKGLAGAPPAAIAAARDTATNPAVLEAFALAIIANGGAPPLPGQPFDAAVAHRDARAVDAATAELRKIVPHPGSYVSESNYFNEHWQQSFWGNNYRRLRGVKATYDPDGLFFVHHGVGSDDWSADGFTRRLGGNV